MIGKVNDETFTDDDDNSNSGPCSIWFSLLLLWFSSNFSLLYTWRCSFLVIIQWNHHLCELYDQDLNFSQVGTASMIH